MSLKSEALAKALTCFPKMETEGEAGITPHHGEHHPPPEDVDASYSEAYPNATPYQSDSYYQSSILKIIASVRDCHSNILDKSEQNLLHCIETLSTSAQRLFFRVYCRKQQWQKVKKLDYSDIDDISGSVDQLTAAAITHGQYICLCRCAY